MAARLGRAADLAGIDVAKERPNPEASFEAGRDTPHEAFSVGVPLEFGGKRARRIDVANATLARTTAEIAVQILDVRRAGTAGLLRACRRIHAAASDHRPSRLCRTNPRCSPRPLSGRRGAAARGSAVGTCAGHRGQRAGGRSRAPGGGTSRVEHADGPFPGCARRSSGWLRRRQPAGRPCGVGRRQPGHRGHRSADRRGGRAGTARARDAHA